MDTVSPYTHGFALWKSCPLPGVVCGACIGACDNCRWRGNNSRATDGNLIEAINMSMNIFQKQVTPTLDFAYSVVLLIIQIFVQKQLLFLDPQ